MGAGRAAEESAKPKAAGVRRLFAEAKESMSRMADELEGDVCECELCVGVDSAAVEEG